MKKISVLILSVLAISLFASVSATDLANCQTNRPDYYANMPVGSKLVGDVGMRYQYQQKSTKLLCLAGCPMTGDNAWDQIHTRGTHGGWWCWAATASMVASYYLRKLGRDSEYLTPDIIAMHAKGGLGTDSRAERFRNLHGRDLPIEYWSGHGTTGNARDPWSLGYADDSIYGFHDGRPSFNQLKTWIDGGHPLIVYYPNHFMAIDGYLENATGQYAHMLNPGTSLDPIAIWIDWATEYGTIDSAWTCPVNAPNVRSDWDWDWNGDGAPDSMEDYDGDGIMDLDEIYVFQTDQTNVDTDGDGVHDKEEIRSYIFDRNGDYTLHLTPGTAQYDPNRPIRYSYHDGTDWVIDWDVIDAVERRADFDDDGLRKELDPDNDDDGLLDGEEDLNHNGIFEPELDETSNFNPDTLPPTTVKTVDSPKYTDASGNIFVTSDTEHTLSICDSGPNGYTGIFDTYCRYYALETSPPVYSSYTGPFNIMGPDGPYIIEYYSKDVAGNNENIHSQIEYLDNAAPTITINSPIAKEYLHSETVIIDFDVTDASGVASISAELDGIPMNDGDTIDLLTLTLDGHTLTITAVDNLGHTTTASVTFDVIANVDSLIELVERFYMNGQIDDPEVRDGLLDKLYAAKALTEAGKTRPARNILRAFIHQVEAQLSHHITEEEANNLIADAEHAIDQL